MSSLATVKTLAHLASSERHIWFKDWITDASNITSGGLNLPSIDGATIYLHLLNLVMRGKETIQTNLDPRLLLATDHVGPSEFNEYVFAYTPWIFGDAQKRTDALIQRFLNFRSPRFTFMYQPDILDSPLPRFCTPIPDSQHRAE